MIAIATIGLCYLTQVVAKAFGVDLPDQQNVTAVRGCFMHALDSAQAFATCAVVTTQVAFLMPVLEEFLFRYLLVKLPARHVSRRFVWTIAAVSSALFSAVHYIFQPFPDSAFIALFFFGLAQCWLYFRTDNILCPMLNHSLFNLTNLVLILVLPQ